jgi:DNA-3-methyladenine glycosylase II
MAKAAPVCVMPDYWTEACAHLMKKDRVMKRLIPQFEGACLQSRGDAFTTLARSIVGQQISVKAAQSVWDRFMLLPRKLTPANVLKLKVDDMRTAGLSARKVEYIVDLALHFDNGMVHVKKWEEMDDETIIAELVAIRGIGRWTAEMFLIFRSTMWASSMASARIIFRANPSAAAMPARWLPRGSPFAAWQLGTFGARWTPCPWNIEQAV